MVGRNLFRLVPTDAGDDSIILQEEKTADACDDGSNALRGFPHGWAKFISLGSRGTKSL